MIRFSRLFFVGFCLFFALSSCGRSYTEEDLSESGLSVDSLSLAKEREEKLLMETNKIMIAKEQERISAYAQRRGWKMEFLDGVFVQILTESNMGKGFVEGDVLVVEYECGLLNGESVYSSKKDGVIVLKVGKGGDCPLGLQMAIERMTDGTNARVIVPYNMAYGLAGDGNKVPKAASLVYELSVKKQNIRK